MIQFFFKALHLVVGSDAPVLLVMTAHICVQPHETVREQRLRKASLGVPSYSELLN